MPGGFRNSFECRATGEQCDRPDCSKKICELENSEKANSRRRDEEDALDEASALAKEIQNVAEYWLPRLIKPGQKITADNKKPAIKELMNHPKVIAEARRRREAIKKLPDL